MKERLTTEQGYEQRVRADFHRQDAMRLLGASLETVEPGHVEISLPYRKALTQQHGLFHAGILATIADTAGGYAAYSLMPSGSEVLTVEFKLNLVAPAKGQRAHATGRVLRPGRTLTVCGLEVRIEVEGTWKTCAWGLLTAIRRTSDDHRATKERT